ncbi:MAG: sulfotransferase domain-containing protein [Candidatus Melainabacteria bacterium]|nr:sulfotransferase domain-containing protein [Candidatus Melainabacteria bacterium]
MKKKAILIHIGYHKTATTWLQQLVFENQDYGFKRYLNKQEIKNRIVAPHPLSFDAAELRSYYDQLDDDEYISVISSERLSGHPHSGGYDAKEICHRLYETFPEAKILIAIREQQSAIISNYLQYVQFGGVCKFKDYIQPTKIGYSNIPLFSFEHFSYLELIKEYIELFGKDKVLVLPYEQFRSEPGAYIAQIMNFTGAPAIKELPYKQNVNHRISSLSTGYLRQLNKVFTKSTLNPSALDAKPLMKVFIRASKLIDSLIPKSIHKFFDTLLTKELEPELADRYQASNKELAALIGQDLKQYGYCHPEEPKAT